MVVREYIREAMPAHITKKFEEFTPDRQADILDKVYTKPFPNRYLASFARFVAENQKDPYLFNLAYHNFELMFDRSILRYEGVKTLPVNFVGSIAHYLSDVLYKVAADKGVKIGNIVGDPMESLTDYHYKKNTCMRITETSSRFNDLEKMSVGELLRNINQEDTSVPIAVEKAIPQIEKLVSAIVEK